MSQHTSCTSFTCCLLSHALGTRRSIVTNGMYTHALEHTHALTHAHALTLARSRVERGIMRPICASLDDPAETVRCCVESEPGNGYKTSPRSTSAKTFRECNALPNVVAGTTGIGSCSCQSRVEMRGVRFGSRGDERNNYPASRCGSAMWLLSLWSSTSRLHNFHCDL